MYRVVLFALMAVGVGVPAMILPGCSRPAQGWVRQASVGKRAPDFEFTDEQGRIRRFRDVRGDLSIVMVSECHGTPHGPISPQLRSLLADTERYPEIDIIGVAIHWAADGCPAGGDCHAIEQDGRVLSICDGHGAVRRLYGVGEEDSLLLLGTRGRILAATSTGEEQTIRNRLADEIEEREAKRMAELIENG